MPAPKQLITRRYGEIVPPHASPTGKEQRFITEVLACEHEHTVKPHESKGVKMRLCKECLLG